MSATSASHVSKRGVARTTVIVLIASESAFFGTLLMSYLYLRTGQASWPFMHPTLPRLVVPIVNTAILVVSTVIAWMALSAARRNDTPALKRWLFISLALGLVFLAGQVFEFTRTGMRPNDLAFGGVFFALMFFHGLHVLGGGVFNGINLYRAELGDFDGGEYAVVEAGVWFWTYVLVVWLMLAAALYLV